jgi:hypothetical protein
MFDSIVDEYKVYRAEDKHECDLLSARVNALLTSQSLLVTASAILYANGKVVPGRVVAIFGMFFCFVVCLAICMSCAVLRRWHEHGKQLVQDNGTALKNYHYGRKQPDIGHFLSIEFFGIGLSLGFLVLWIVALVLLN